MWNFKGERVIIGITGYARHGKDTVARYLKDYINETHPSYDVVIASLADPIKRAACEMFGWEYPLNDATKDTVDVRYGVSPRQVLQVLGTEFGQYMLMDKFPDFKQICGRKLWVKRLLDQYQDVDFLLIPDVRFLHEVDEIRSVGSANKIISVYRPDYSIDTTHVSEQEIGIIPNDTLIINDGSLYDLDIKIREYGKTLFTEDTLRMKKKIYISGPISGVPNDNKDAFVKAKEFLHAKNWIVRTPFDPDILEYTKKLGENSWQNYMKPDIMALMECDAIYMLSTYAASRGARIEKLLAEELGYEVYYQGAATDTAMPDGYGE